MISSIDHGVIENIGFTAVGNHPAYHGYCTAYGLAAEEWKITLKPFLVAASLFLLCGSSKT